MPKRTVLDVGNCAPDFAGIKKMLTSHFDVDVVQADRSSDALAIISKRSVDLVLINRKLDCDYSDGTAVLADIKAVSDVPVMIVTNYDEHQDAAVSLGAERGFGKLELNSEETIRKLAPFLS
ncbi:MAG: response regulator [Planctomycetales bacterium]|nr:response regulator [Planctomycetales bacterium]